MYRNGKSSYQIKKEKLQKIKKILSEEIPEKKAWKMTKDDLINYYQVQQAKIWEIIINE